MLFKRFQQNWKVQFNHLSTSNCHLLLAVSGGIDSIVLTDLISKAGFDFTIAHCNFQLREEESERDEVFVRSLGEKCNKEVLVKRFNTKEHAVLSKLSVQEAARNLRYQWFQEVLATNYKLQTINLLATAHHANDNIETLLNNFFRGTGISGLHGILPKLNNIIRPLLFAKREEIETYANENNLGWVEDSSNTSEKYTRNLFRLKIIPEIKEVYQNVEDNLLNSIERFKETEILYHQAIALHKKKLVEQKGNEVHIPILKLQKSEPLHSIMWEIIKDFGFNAQQVNEVKKLFIAENGSYVASASYRIIRNRNWLIIAPLKAKAAQNILIEKDEKMIVFENGILELESLLTTNCKLQNTNSIACLDAAEIKFPLLLRKWKQGDYFYPLGMQKKKKLSKFFIDLKLSKTDKEKVWVIEMNKKIAWVIGYRIDDRFKLTDKTKNVIRLAYKNS
ncbi:MAG TPA: tRNA lysidine(34) synthetase TilS [Panacibacter sp.]|nr:tRNA lysidine(34) synthetase TilS [Panacibacter sp.]